MSHQSSTVLDIFYPTSNKDSGKSSDTPKFGNKLSKLKWIRHNIITRHMCVMKAYVSFNFNKEEPKYNSERLNKANIL